MLVLTWIQGCPLSPPFFPPSIGLLCLLYKLSGKRRDERFRAFSVPSCLQYVLCRNASKRSEKTIREESANWGSAAFRISSSTWRTSWAVRSRLMHGSDSLPNCDEWAGNTKSSTRIIIACNVLPVHLLFYRRFFLSRTPGGQNHSLVFYVAYLHLKTAICTHNLKRANTHKQAAKLTERKAKWKQKTHAALARTHTDTYTHIPTHAHA